MNGSASIGNVLHEHLRQHEKAVDEPCKLEGRRLRLDKTVFGKGH